MKYVLSVALWLKPQNFFINADGVVLSQECRTFVERHFSSFTFLVCIVFGERQLICHSVLIHHKFQGKGRNIFITSQFVLEYSELQTQPLGKKKNRVKGVVGSCICFGLGAKLRHGPSRGRVLLVRAIP